MESSTSQCSPPFAQGKSPLSVVSIRCESLAAAVSRLDGRLEGLTPASKAGPCTQRDPLPTRRTHRGSGERLVSLSDLKNVAHLSQEKAAAALNVGNTRFKSACRELGMKGWPYRKIKSVRNLQLTVEENLGVVGGRGGVHGRLVAHSGPGRGLRPCAQGVATSDSPLKNTPRPLSARRRRPLTFCWL